MKRGLGGGRYCIRYGRTVLKKGEKGAPAARRSRSCRRSLRAGTKVLYVLRTRMVLYRGSTTMKPTADPISFLLRDG